ncbi:MAG TPA: zinc ribbon domain-containing protein [Patescibacteria group bacterium]|nr:zinc ribbon domain-containing protein [Patescibacteria group bacterium]
MDSKPRCQSCGMPLGIGFYGTNKDGSPSSEYCKFCFENGEFREPDITLDEMMGRSVANMVDDLGMGREEAERLAQETIPNLKRWKVSS